MSEQTPTNISNADFTFKDKNGNTGSNKGITDLDKTKLNNMVKLLNLLLNTPNSLDFVNTLANINLSNLSASGTGIINSLIDTKLSDKANATDLSNYLPLSGGNVTGNLTVQNKNIDVIEEQGNGYIRYSNGLQICWGTITWQSTCTIGWGSLYETNPVQWSYAKSFIEIPSFSASGYMGDSSAMIDAGAGSKTSTPCVWLCRATNISDVTSCIVRYTAIGRWK